MHPDLIKITEIFLIPSSFLVAALGTADTNPHRAAVSLLGLLVSVLWFIGSQEALPELLAASAQPRKAIRVRILAWMPVIFISGWIASLIAHVWMWSLP